MFRTGLRLGAGQGKSQFLRVFREPPTPPHEERHGGGQGPRILGISLEKSPIAENSPPSALSLRNLLVFAVILIGLAYAWALLWVAEDAYISLRYARNLVEGHGLVFNPGERVEGYTNFLWTLFLAAGLKAGGTPATLSLILGLIFSGAALFSLGFLHRGSFPDAVFPAALLALGLNYSWASFSTSGMETSLLAFLLVTSFAALNIEGTHPRGKMICAATGVLLALAAMTRPDAVLALPVAAATLMLRRRPFKQCLLLLAAFTALFVPYFLWRASYYGDWLPNTFYAKSGSGAYYAQGWRYAAEFLSRYNLWFLLPLVAIALFVTRLRDKRAPGFVGPAIAFTLIYSFYVIRIGGDFMEGRFFIPVLPFLYLLLEWSVRAFDLRRIWTAIGVAIVVLSAGADRNRLPEHTIVNGITDERSWQPVVNAWLYEGQVLGSSLPPKALVATDAIGAFGWASRLPIIDTLGLTDRTVAHLPLAKRSRPGHEKAAPVAYLQARRVAIVRDGIGIYRNSFGAPAFIFAGSRYYQLSSETAVAQGLRKAKDRLAERN